jgi:pyruvate decarboxylase
MSTQVIYRQTTVQELSVMIRSGVKPIIFVLNNSGYTIERYINGKDRSELSFFLRLYSCSYTCGNRKYHDIVNWDWTLLLTVLGDTTGKLSRTYQARSIPELEMLLRNEEFEQAKYIQLVEVVMDKMDAPETLKRFMRKRKEEERKEQPELYGEVDEDNA